jgi:hypothetical protein
VLGLIVMVLSVMTLFGLVGEIQDYTASQPEDHNPHFYRYDNLKPQMCYAICNTRRSVVLRHCLLQIQAVLYETHSVVPAENSEMVTRVVNEMNKNARDKHVEEQTKLHAASKMETSETSAASGGETVAAPASSVVSFQNPDEKNPGKPSFPETDVSVSCSSCYHCLYHY